MILTLDVEPNILSSLGKMLEKEGHAVLLAASGPDAVELVRKGTPDLIVMDVDLSEPSGVETLERIQKIAPEVPVVLTAAIGPGEAVWPLFRRGSYCFLPKPFRVPELKSAIRKSLA